MTNDGSKFFEKINEIVFLLREILKKTEREGTKLEDILGYSYFEDFVEEFNQIKQTIPQNLLGFLDDSIEEIITPVVELLKNELGIIDNDSDNRVSYELNRIDSLLKSKTLSDSEIDDLLDKRSELNSNKRD